MKEFIIGFFTCWNLFGAFEMLSEKFDWYY